MKRNDLSRRDFGKLSLAAFGGLLAGSMVMKPGRLFADDKDMEKHACCGLNSCKGEGSGGDNSCAGTGKCATVEAHGCNGHNDCKNQGGSADNDCKGHGTCAVPIKGDTWTAARKSFEDRMTKAGTKFGPAPDTCGK